MKVRKGEGDPRYPCLLIDDDGWLVPCRFESDVQLAVEPDFLYDIVAAFDSRGCPLTLHEREDLVVPEVAGPPAPGELVARVREFFDTWTDSRAPALRGDIGAWVTAVIALEATSPKLRRRRESGRPSAR